MQNALENKRTQMRRGVLELCILSIIAEEEVYTSDIIQKLRESKLTVVEGTLYPLLSRLRKANLLAYSWRESDSGPPRKYYKITNEGEIFLHGLLDTWMELVLAVSESTKNIRTNE